MKKFLLFLILIISVSAVRAQIGYQVSLLDSATGEPRANETVTYEVKLTNSEDGVIWSGSQSATSNDFGVVSLTVGDANMFNKMDWSKLPLYIEVTVDEKLIGRSQVFSVPVAEYAKKTGELTYENIGSKKIVTPTGSFSFRFIGHQVEMNFPDFTYDEEGNSHLVDCIYTGTYYIEGNTVFGHVKHYKENNEVWQEIIVGHYSSEADVIYIGFLDH